MSDLNTEFVAMKRERDRFVKLAFCRADLLFELAHDYRVVFAAGATKPIFGKEPEALAGILFLDLIGEENRAYAQALLEAGGAEGRIDDAVIEFACPGGASLPMALAGYRAPEFDNHVFLAVKVSPQPVSHVATAQLEVADDSALLTQESFSQAAAERIMAIDRSGGESQVTLVKIKSIKDLVKTMAASDRHDLMKAIGDILRTHSIGGNTAGQLTEDTFSYLHGRNIEPETVNAEVAETAARFLPDDQALDTQSATLDADGAGMTEEQCAKALVFTMQQFTTGKSKIAHDRLSDSLEELMSGTVETVKYLKQVTSKRDFDVLFMPICDLRLGKVHHFEALSRFRDPKQGKSTAQVVTLAENLDLIQDFDMAVVEKTVALTTAFHQRGFLPSVAINLSSLSMSSDSFVANLNRLIKETPGMDKLVQFELTEATDIDDLARMNTVIQSLRGQGFQMSLDDFGSGASSLDYLSALEVDMVKFDGPVVRRACASKRGHEVLSAMARMCSQSSILTVAEMAEDKTIANQVFYCGIDYGQGWHFGKPEKDPFLYAEKFAGKSA